MVHEPPTDPDTAELVFSEIRDLLRRQESKLKEARSRAGTVLAVSAFALSFLGGSILSEPSRPSVWFWAGVTFVFAGVLAFLWVLIPPRRATLFFSPDPEVLIESYLPLDGHEAKEHLARYMTGWVEDNQPQIDPLFTALRWGTLSLGAGLVVLLAELAGVV
jgi:hypothetical protein